MNNQYCYLKLGKLYLESIYLDNEEPNTYFIRDIEFTCNKDSAVKYLYEDAIKIMDLLKLINIDVDVE